MSRKENATNRWNANGANACVCADPGRRIGVQRIACGMVQGGARIANGAGIAADPTLTGVWMCRLCWTSGEPSILASVSAYFRARCLASGCLRLAAGLARDLSPALAPASGFRSCRVSRPPPDRSLRASAALHSRLAETASLYRLRLSRLGAFAVSASLAVRPGSWPVRCHRVAPTLRVSRLAIGRSLLHAVSRSARGQMSPPSLG